MKRVAILQARTNSSRLPGKVLLPVNGIPLVVLAAKRAANTGIDVIVATSIEQSDDALANILAEHSLRYYRGSLDNTLERIVNALDGFDNDTIVFRLTADNVFPDGSLLDDIEKEFIKKNVQYLCCNGIQSGLPYGVSVEATYLKHLRVALKETSNPYDREHVTPFIRRKFGDAYFNKYEALKKGHYRSTVDCLDDYLVIQNVFLKVTDSIKAPMLDLIDKLNDQKYQPIQDSPVAKMVLGTAQLGLNYGISNKHGKPNSLIAEKILKTSIANGIGAIDTARAYGNSEEIIGNSLKSGWVGRTKVITKLAPLSDCPKNASMDIVNSFVDASIFQSCCSLRVQKLDVVLLHRASQIHDWDGAVWNRLVELKNNNVIGQIGISVQDAIELEYALNNQDVSYIQMPYNLLDWRWDTIIPAIRNIKKERQLFIHARSALLQGLLPSDNISYWHKAYVENPNKIIRWLNNQCSKYNIKSIAELCLKFVAATDWIDGVVVGVETLEQLHENIRIMADSNPIDIENLLLSRPIVQEKTLNPACWRQS